MIKINLQNRASRGIIVLVVVLSLVVIGLWAFRLYKWYDATVLNNYFVPTLSIWCAEFTKGGDQLNEEDLFSLVHKRGAGEGSAYASRFAQFPVILDFWDTPIRHSNKEDGFE